MKNYFFYFVHFLSLIYCCFFNVSFVSAQTISSSNWQEFVNSVSNPVIKDTFRIQTFDGTEKDNWGYEGRGTHSIIDASGENFNVFHDDLKTKNGYKSQKKDTLRMNLLDISNYSNVNFRFCIGGTSLGSTDELKVKIYKDTGIVDVKLYSYNGSNSSMTLDYKTVNSMPYGIEFFTKNSSNYGYFLLKYIIAIGDIQRFSRFSGSGNWNDTLKWSHLPALRNRTALLEGKVRVDSILECKRILMGEDSEIHIEKKAALTVDSLEIFTQNPCIIPEGTLTVNEKLIVHKTFETLGKWYFISFPFDVYTEDIDSLFQQGDNTTLQSGNYYYVHSYDGDKRAVSQTNKGNWIVEAIKNKGEVVFQKYKGYLIALDKEASTNSMWFSSASGKAVILSSAVSIPVVVNDALSQKNDNFGWYLLGNPFMMPFHPSQSEKSNFFDGKVYGYVDNGFVAFDESSSLSFPALSAFFVKVSGSTEIDFNIQSSDMKQNVLSEHYLESLIEEPRMDYYTDNMFPAVEDVSVKAVGNKLFIENLTQKASIFVYTIDGKLILNKNITEKNTEIDFCFPKDVYLVRIKTSDRIQNIKIIHL